MRIILSILFFQMYSTLYSQIDLQNSSFENINNKFTLKVIHVGYDTTVLDFGKGGKHLSLSANKMIWGLHHTSNDSLLYSFNHLNMRNKRVLISSNGDNIILFNQLVDYKHPVREIIAIEFFTNGKLSKQYKLKDLIAPKKQLIKSRNGGIWCFEDFQILNDSVFKLYTIDFKSMTFNLKTGRILSNEYMKGINKKTVILYGDIDKNYINNDSYTIQVDYIIQGGKLKYNEYQFSSETDLDAIYKLIVINDGKYDSILNKYQFEGIK